MEARAYEEYSDEELVALGHQGDAQAVDLLLGRYKNLVRLKARTYFLVGADREDIIQEGMIGLYKAIRDYDEKGASFHAFAELCITRQMLTAIKAATRRKHEPLNSYVSFSKPVRAAEGDERTLVDVFEGARSESPEDLLIGQENIEDIHRGIDELLSPFEAQVLDAYLKGSSYQQIAQDMNRSAKSIDNALQRIKRKLERFRQ